jgi:PAS domain S-box-containing protein
MLGENGKYYGRVWYFRDITERKKAEDAVRESAERYKSLITLSNTGAWEYDSDRNYVWCSPEYFSMLGRDASQYDLSGRANLKEVWIDLLHPDDLDWATEQFTRYIGSESPGIYENHFRMQHADGHWVWILSRGRTLHHENGTPTNKTIGTMIDVTESRRAEEKLRVYTEHLCLAQEIGKIGSWELDIATGMLWGSEETFRLSGITRPADGLIPLEAIEAKIQGRKKLRQALQNLIETGAPFDLEYSINPDDGSSQRNLHSVARLINNTEKKSVRVAGVIQDVTSRIQAERELKNKNEALNAAYSELAINEKLLMTQLDEIGASQNALRESEEQFRCIADTVNEGVWSMNSRFVTTFVNRKMTDLLGYTREEMVGRNITDYMDPTKIPDNTIRMQNRRQGLDEVYTRKFRHKDGSVHLLQVTMKVLKDPTGAFAGSFATFFDITDRKKTEWILCRGPRNPASAVEPPLMCPPFKAPVSSFRTQPV